MMATKVTNLEELKQALYEEFNDARGLKDYARRAGLTYQTDLLQAEARLAGRIIEVEKELQDRADSTPKPLVGKKPTGPQLQ
jgi:hypothetical protein